MGGSCLGDGLIGYHKSQPSQQSRIESPPSDAFKQHEQLGPETQQKLQNNLRGLFQSVRYEVLVSSFRYLNEKAEVDEVKQSLAPNFGRCTSTLLCNRDCAIRRKLCHDRLLGLPQTVLDE